MGKFERMMESGEFQCQICDAPVFHSPYEVIKHVFETHRREIRDKDMAKMIERYLKEKEKKQAD